MGEKFDLDDILIQPEIITNITSRSDVKIWDKNGNLPLFVSPMDTVVDDDNEELYHQLGLNVCLPRGMEPGNNESFKSLSLIEFKNEYIDNNDQVINSNNHQNKILIDIANGHMSDLFDVVEKFKKSSVGKNVELIIGNIANPDTYRLFCNLGKYGPDYIRLGIGNGSGCLTTQQLGVGYPMGSLISECSYIKEQYDHPPKIIADGGMKKYADIIKSLALGADYVMLGSLLAKSLESCGSFFEDNLGKSEISKEQAKILFDHNRNVFKNFRGMSTKEVQKKWGKTDLKTSEGVSRIYRIEYTLEGFVSNFEDYLRSAMSYTNCDELNVFIGGPLYNLITQNAHNRFNK